MIARSIVFFGHPCLLVCDAKCNKAWGINQRPTNQLSEEEDDYEWLADDELPEAPEYPGTFEGGEGKPVDKSQRLNRWCARECERHIIVDNNEDFVLPDFSK